MSKRNYVNNDDFVKALVEYNELIKTKPDAKIPDYIGACIDKICRKTANRKNFISYPYRDEMIFDGILDCIKAVTNFDVEKSKARSRTGKVNAFGYLTRVTWNAFLRRMAEEKKHQYIKHKNMYNSGLHNSLEEESYNVVSKRNLISEEIIENYENNLTKKKKPSILGVEKFLSEEPLNNDSKTFNTTNSN
jgi:hypothetical protein